MKFSINGEFWGLNEYVKAVAFNRYKGGKVKSEETQRVFIECKNQSIKPITKYPVIVKFKWYSKNAKKDVDNVAFAKKFILDGMVVAGVLENDSRKFVEGFEDLFFIDKENPRVEIEI